MNDPAALEDAAELMRVMGHPIRLALIQTIANTELSVGEIEARTAVSQPTLSQQLAVLRKADMVSTRRQAKQIFYRLNPARLEMLTAFMCHLAAQIGITQDSMGISVSAHHAPEREKLPDTPQPSRQSNGVAMFAQIKPSGKQPS